MKTLFQKLKNTNLSIFNKLKFIIYNANRDELLQELKQSLELYDISSDSINYVYLEKSDQSITILITKKGNIGQSNASVTSVQPKTKYLTVMYKITPISSQN